MRGIIRFSVFFVFALALAIVTGWDAAGVMACMALAVASNN